MNKKLLWSSIVLATLGAVNAGYLWIYKITNNDLLCLGSGDCMTVNYSAYSEVYGIPVSLLGLLAYLTILVTLILELRVPFFKTNGHLLVFSLSLAGLIYSAYLSYIEFYVIYAICPFCLASAFIMTLVFILSTIRLAHLFKH